MTAFMYGLDQPHGPGHVAPMDGLAGRGVAMTAFMYGLDQPHGPGHVAPMHALAVARAATAVDNCLTAASTLSTICSEPVLTSATPSLPTEAVTLVPSTTSM